MIQRLIRLRPMTRGFHLISSLIERELPEIRTIEMGILHLFIKHTSASLSINENADPTVRDDMEAFYSDMCDDKSYYVHTYEGADDMPAHIKSSLLGCSLTIPITDGRLNMGIWQGIYLGEHRNHASSREIVATISS